MRRRAATTGFICSAIMATTGFFVPAATLTATQEQARAAGLLVGTTPPEWQADLWLNTAPLRLADLRGKVVLVRWWTAHCPFCSTTAPALRKLDETYAKRGLVVVGMYHHKGSDPFDPAVYRATARAYGFTFPLAVDTEWRTLRSWMRQVDPGWTSVTFILDRRGVVRYVHPGGQYVQGDAAYAAIETTVERLLAS